MWSASVRSDEVMADEAESWNGMHWTGLTDPTSCLGMRFELGERTRARCFLSLFGAIPVRLAY